MYLKSLKNKQCVRPKLELHIMQVPKSGMMNLMIQNQMSGP